jgi:hypothetical protein
MAPGNNPQTTLAGKSEASTPQTPVAKDFDFNSPPVRLSTTALARAIDEDSNKTFVDKAANEAQKTLVDEFKIECTGYIQVRCPKGPPCG